MDRYGWERKDFKRDHRDGYLDGQTDTAWRAWQLRAALAAKQGRKPMTETERADMICAIGQICTGSGSRTVAALAIEWTERRYGIRREQQS